VGQVPKGANYKLLQGWQNINMTLERIVELEGVLSGRYELEVSEETYLGLVAVAENTVMVGRYFF
jgi:hypothetical protein